jgi:hypothetical protein
LSSEHPERTAAVIAKGKHVTKKERPPERNKESER